MRKAAVGFVRRGLHALRRRIAPPPIIRLVRDEHARVLDNQLLRGRHVLITGAGRNIGRSIALEMAQQGASIYCTDLNAAALTNLEQELTGIGAHARTFVSDGSSPSDIDVLCAALQADGIVIDVLVNNLGIRRRGGVLTLDMADLRASFETNVFGPLYLTQRIVGALTKTARPGTVIFLTSVHERSTIGDCAYSASKAALAMIVRELALELAPHRIRVNAIAPGGVNSVGHDQIPPFAGSALYGAAIHPSYIGRTAVYLASEYFSQFTTGSTVTVDAGLLTRPQHD